MAKLTLGCTYTREQIHAILGGGVQSFLPTKNGRVICGCFRLDLNPDAPREILVGVGEQRVRNAQTLKLQGTSVPVFTKKVAEDWEYVGHFKATRYLEKNHPLLADEPRTKREDIAGILYLEPFEVPVVPKRVMV